MITNKNGKLVVFTVELRDEDGCDVLHVSSSREIAYQWIKEGWEHPYREGGDWGREQQYWWAVFPEVVDADENNPDEVLYAEEGREHALDLLDCYGSIVKNQPPETYSEENQEICNRFFSRPHRDLEN